MGSTISSDPQAVFECRGFRTANAAVSVFLFRRLDRGLRILPTPRASPAQLGAARRLQLSERADGRGGLASLIPRYAGADFDPKFYFNPVYSPIPFGLRIGPSLAAVSGTSTSGIVAGGATPKALAPSGLRPRSSGSMANRLIAVRPSVRPRDRQRHQQRRARHPRRARQRDVTGVLLCPTSVAIVRAHAVFRSATRHSQRECRSTWERDVRTALSTKPDDRANSFGEATHAAGAARSWKHQFAVTESLPMPRSTSQAACDNGGWMPRFRVAGRAVRRPRSTSDHFRPNASPLRQPVRAGTVLPLQRAAKFVPRWRRSAQERHIPSSAQAPIARWPSAVSVTSAPGYPSASDAARGHG